jgi:hypothetical protein
LVTIFITLNNSFFVFWQNKKILTEQTESGHADDAWKNVVGKNASRETVSGKTSDEILKKIKDAQKAGKWVCVVTKISLIYYRRFYS